MSNFKPSLTYKTHDSLRLYEMRDKKRDYIFESYPTYRKVKSRVINVLKHENPIDNEVSVSRSRRGEWGEWFETWALVDGKPKIIKQGWM